MGSTVNGEVIARGISQLSEDHPLQRSSENNESSFEVDVCTYQLASWVRMVRPANFEVGCPTRKTNDVVLRNSDSVLRWIELNPSLYRPELFGESTQHIKKTRNNSIWVGIKRNNKGDSFEKSEWK